jgi:hypothetical protein
MNSATTRLHASPSPAAWRSSSSTFRSLEVVRKALDPSGKSDPVGRSVFRYSTPRACSSSFSSEYAAEPAKRGCQEEKTSWTNPGSVISAVRMAPPSSSLRSSTSTRLPALARRAAPTSELIPLPTKTAS